MTELQLPPFSLASESPRRGQLLEQHGFAFEQVRPPFDDTGVTLDAAAPHRAAEALAYLKAASVADTLHAGLVVGCDTVVVQQGRAFGKPEDLADARAMLSQLVDARHDVVTGMAIIDAAGDRVDVFHDRTAVTIGKVPHRELEEYLNSGGWVGKAGGYNLAELERLWPFEIEGDPTTVIGLPIETLSSRLGRFAGRGGG